jgi:hypothetical protein
MRRLSAAAVIVMTALLLSGCLATGAPDSTRAPSSQAAATPTPTPTPVVAAGLVLSLDQIVVVNSDGSRGDSARLEDWSATLALLSTTLGRTPVPSEIDNYGFQSYDWGGISLTVQTATSTSLGVTFKTPDIDGLALQTTEGIRVGSARAAVAIVASPGTEFEWDYQGTTDTRFGLQARPRPGNESLAFPDRVALDFVDIELSNGVVTSIGSPGGDWLDL